MKNKVGRNLTQILENRLECGQITVMSDTIAMRMVRPGAGYYGVGFGLALRL